MNYRYFFVVFYLLSLWSFLPTAGQDIDHWESIIKVGDEVNYFLPSEELPQDWKTLNYDDSGWESGISGVGYEDGDDNTIIPNTRSVYLRYIFNIPDPAIIVRILLDMDFDDGFVAYLNGYEIARENMGSQYDATSFDQFTDTDIEARIYQGLIPSRYNISNNFIDSLLLGQNILAIEVHNWSDNSSDLSSNTFLQAGISNSNTYFSQVPGWFIAPTEGISNLPIISINTLGQSIPDEPRIIADMGLIYNGPGIENRTTDPFNEYSGKISIEIRGASSQMFEKKSYTIETQTDTGSNNNVILLGMPAENDWVLYGPYSDKSLVRNVLSYKIYEQMGHWSPRTRFIDLYINEVYRGIYVLTEKIKQDAYRVNIAELSATDISDDEISGGYILQIDRTGNLSPEEYWTTPTFSPYPGFPRNTFEYYDPKYFELTSKQAEYIKEWINNVDKVMGSSNYRNKDTGYRKYIDVPSFVDYLILHELNKDIDAYRLSAFFYKDRDSNGGKLKAGPPWDYNLTYGNMFYGEDSRETYNWMYTRQVSMYWWKRLMDDPWFINKVHCRWRSLSNTVLIEDNLFNIIDSSIQVLGPTIEANFERWPILGTYVWPNDFIGETHAEEIDFLKTWISERLEWLDFEWAFTCIETNKNQDVIIHQKAVHLYPNPSNQATVMLSLPISYLGEYQLEFFNLQGAKILENSGVLDFGNILELQNMDNLSPGVYLLKFSGNGISPLFGKLIRE